MCAPAVIPLVLAAAGAYVSNEGAKKADRAKQQALEVESGRQKKLADESHSIFGQGLDYNQGDQQQAREDATSKSLAGKYQQATDTSFSNIFQPREPAAGGAGAPKIVADTMQRAGAEAKDRLSGEMMARAKLGAFGQMLSAAQRNSQNLSAQQQQLSGFAAGSQRVLPLELAAASRQGESTRNLGQLLSLAGTAVGAYGTSQALGAALNSGASTAAKTTAEIAASGAQAAGSGAYTAVNPYTKALMYRPPV